MLIALLENYNAILEKSWINKHDVLLDMLKDKILFVLERYNYDDDVTFFLKDLIFLFISTESIQIETSASKPAYDIKSDLIDSDLVDVNIKTLSSTSSNSKVTTTYLSLVVEIDDIDFSYIISNIDDSIE